MLSPKARLFRAALDSLYATGAYRLFGGGVGGIGVIFTLHHVRPDPRPAEFAPNRILEITPEFLDGTLTQLAEMGIEMISLDEMVRRFRARDFGRRFACFTLDDGYRDNLTHALPVFERHGVPFTVYVTTGLPEGRVDMWWLALERIVQDHVEVEWPANDNIERRPANNAAEKHSVFEEIYWSVRAMREAEQRGFTSALAERYGIDRAELCLEDSLNWDEVATLARHPLCTIGAHTQEHVAMSKMSEDDIARDLEQCLDKLASVTGARPRHFAYPFGDPGSAAGREFAIAARFGFDSAVTTRKGMLFPEHAGHLLALPRVSLNGDYQKPRYVTLYVSGAPFALWNRFKRLDVA